MFPAPIQGILYMPKLLYAVVTLRILAGGNGGKVRAVVEKKVYRFHDGADVLLRAGSANPGLARRVGQLSRQMKRDHQDRYFGEHLRYLLCYINTV